MGKIGARQSDILKAISTAPSFNKTPVGNAIPPLPYPTTQDLSNSASVAKTVRFNGHPAYTLHQTEQPNGKGDDPGTAKGVKSGTVNGYVKPTSAADHFRVEKHYLVRQGDANVMNCGNNPGIYITTQVPHMSVSTATENSADPSGPPIKAETPDEEQFLSAQGNALAPALGEHINTGKLLAIAALATQAGVTLAPCVSFIPGKKS